MREENRFKPESVTFWLFYLAADHGRLEDKGLEIFDVMVKGNNGIQAEIEHYGCVVDLLRSAGRVEEGFEFYQKDAF